MNQIPIIKLPEYGSREKHFSETGEYPESCITFAQETIIAEYTHLVPWFTEQLLMPMVTQNYGGDILFLMFQRCLGGFLEVLMREGLITPAFLEKQGKYLDSEHGIKRKARMNNAELHSAFCDLEEMINHFWYAAGWSDGTN
ncbi:MAG TPA: hypothetical protein DEQ02_06725 [Ruminococcaceae bacterium]|nr:hypothetical protein [Oscillospiraceae bacterium]